MQLRTYREHNNLTLANVAELLRLEGVQASNASTVRRHEAGIRKPSVAVIEAYRRITRNAVTYADWVELGSRPSAPTVPQQKEAVNG